MSKLKYFNSFIIIIFLYSGLIKWINFGIDITLISLIILSLIIIYSLKRKINIIGTEIKIIITFGIFYSLTSIYTLSDNYFLEKILYLWMAIFSFILPSIILSEKEDLNSFYNVYNFFGLLCLILLSYLLLTNQWYIFITNDYNNDSFPNYLAVGGFLGVAIILNIKKKKLIYKILILTGIVFMFLLSGRGPLIALVLSLLIYLFLSEGKFKKLTSIILLIMVSSLLYFSFSQIDEVINSYNRFSNLFDNDVRINQIKEALEIISDNIILGVGIGGYGMASVGVDEFWHPHNMFLEILSESGLFIFLIFFYLLIKIFLINNYKFQVNEINIVIILAAFFLFIQTMKSGGIADYRITFFWLGMMTYIIKKFRNNSLEFLN